MLRLSDAARMTNLPNTPGGIPSFLEHITHIHRTIDGDTGGTRSWFAACDCGWQGKQRAAVVKAHEDANSHTSLRQKESQNP